MAMNWNCEDMDGHKFNIPLDQIEDFNDRMEEIEECSDEWYDKIEEFNDLYSKYNMVR